MATAIESGIGTTNYGRQPAKGTVATAATTTVGYDRPKWQGGNLRPGKKLASKEYIDGQRFGSPTPYTDMVGGEVGSLTLQLQPENIGLYFAAILGVDTVTGADDPYTHTITSAGTTGHWASWWQKVGSAIGPQRELYWDSKIAKLTATSNFADKVMLGELDIQALVAAEVFTTDAAKTETATEPFLHTEASGSFEVDGTVIREVNEAITTIDTQMSPYFGDDITPIHLIEGKGQLTQSMKAIITDDTLAKYNKAIYNDATPSAGDLPVKEVFSAATEYVYTRSATRTVTISCPKVDINPEPFAVAPTPEGGPLPIDFAGACRKDGSTPALSVVVLAAETASYA